MKTYRHPAIRTYAALASVAALVTVTSCSNDADKAPETGATASESPRAPSGDNGDLADPVGARADLSDFECETDGETWSASGRLKNVARQPATYLVRVSLADGDAGTVLGSVEKSVTVAAKDSVPVRFEAFHTGDRKGSCVARVVKSS